ncbi:glycerophosphodiester phosphodiesterase family protein [Bifidobacterium panos]|uniref:Phosphodiesterase n=1 Tax=Bifidobacterium panos TaxID=2675321 RepID=A0ABX1T1C0_9BIFI|nr:glycerophosphodiester phosphodiesterase family protein [Bifidobacterium sp. DSM 109963]NMN02438.1 phosphodiesterase [Bifidobacterium sp. DSM 109963]
MSRSFRSALIGGAVIAGMALWAIAPRSFSDKQHSCTSCLPDVLYAHRGLHDAGSGLTKKYARHSGPYVELARRMAIKAGYGNARVKGPIAPENSLAAFAAACEAGYGIELDVRRTRDGQIVVAHDRTLLRVAGDPRAIENLTYDELTRIPLFPTAKPGDATAEPLPGSQERPARVSTPAAPPKGYHQHVPLLSEVLKLVDGRVPLIVEYKSVNEFSWDARDEDLMEKGHALLKGYEGPYAVESFHPTAVNWYKEHWPEVYRGQVAHWPSADNDKSIDLKRYAAGLLAFDWRSRPDFIAYDWRGGSMPQVRLARLLGAVPVSWTVRSHEELAQAERDFDHHIFEAFVPDGQS